MKVVHLSDTHLGYRQFHKIDPETGINQREQDVYDGFERVVDRIVELAPDLVIHAGDLFDTVRPTNRAVNKAMDEFGRLSREEIPTVVIAGNHDTPKMATTGTIMQALDQLPAIHAVTSRAEADEEGYRTITVGTMTVHAVADAPTQDQLRRRLDSVEPDPNTAWNVLVLHAGVRQIQDEVFSGEFNEHYVSADWLAELKMDYVALGHYHKRMPIGEGVHARYCGGTERFGFNEADYDPGFLELDFGAEIDVTEHTIDARTMVKIPEIDASDQTADELAERITEQLPPEAEREGMLLSLTVNNLDAATQSLLDGRLLMDLRDQVFESQIQLVGPEGNVSTGGDLEFQDLRQEFEVFMNDREIEEAASPETIIETGRQYLSRALGEEDEV